MATKKARRRRRMPPQFEELLTDKQLRDASTDQITDLVARIDMMLRSCGEPGLVPPRPDDLPKPADPADPLDPGAIGTE
jgi:hypothetical protein